MSISVRFRRLTWYASHRQLPCTDDVTNICKMALKGVEGTILSARRLVEEGVIREDS